MTFHLIDSNILHTFILGLDKHLESPIEIVLVGGAAVIVLCSTTIVEITKDIDVISTTDSSILAQAIMKAVILDEIPELDINSRVQAFETCLPEDWENRIVKSDIFSSEMVSIFTPCPEDLAISKLFRYHSKDVEDIKLLAQLPTFDRDAFHSRFLRLLPVAIGPLRYHAQSFILLWKALFPHVPINEDEIYCVIN